MLSIGYFWYWVLDARGREVSLVSNTQVVQVFLSHATIGCDFARDLASALWFDPFHWVMLARNRLAHVIVPI